MVMVPQISGPIKMRSKKVRDYAFCVLGGGGEISGDRPLFKSVI